MLNSKARAGYKAGDEPKQITSEGLAWDSSSLPGVSPPSAMAGQYRLLKGNEVVKHGDFMENEFHQLEPWEGLRGFQAASFVKPIYRKKVGNVVAARGLIL